MKVSLNTGSLAALSLAFALQFKGFAQNIPGLSELNETNSLMLVIGVVLFVNAYNLTRTNVFLITTGLILHLAKAEMKLGALCWASAIFMALGFGLSATQAPLMCKIYAFVGGVSYYLATTGHVDYWMVCVYWAALIFIKRLIVLILTAKTSFPASYIFGFISNLMPAYYFSRYDFFRADAPPEEIAIKREIAFDALQAKWDSKWPKSTAFGNDLRKVFSDLRFAAGNRVFLPFKKILDEWCDPFTISTHTDRMNLIDIDGHSQLDVSGSYGVNVVGYDKYKEFITNGWKKMDNLGCVLGPVHPILLDNIEMLRKISGKDEVSFHMSGTEATMSACRLARFNTRKNLVVMFSGAYHGWWDGVQSTAGNERYAEDVLTLTDMADSSLRILRWRANEIACVLVNPLQAFHANSPPPSDTVLATDNRNAGADWQKYADWLQKLKKTCADGGIVLIFDEVYTGFRLAPGGAQEYFKCEGDIVCYGKTLGGGMPNGVCCGPSWLMARCDPKRPLRLAYVIGTFSAHPLLLGAMNEFLTWVTTKEAADLYDQRHREVLEFVIESNKQLEKENIPLKLASYCTVWTMLFQTPGRYHWILQYYLKDEGINLSWVGTGRLNFSLDFTKDDMNEVRERMMKACRRMRDDGWWYYDPKAPKMAIKLKLAKEVGLALVKSCFGY